MALKKLFIIITASIFLFVTKAYSEEECFEKTSRSIFKFNMGLDKAVIKPIAKGYNKLPKPIRNGTNISNLPFCFKLSLI